MTKSSRTLGLLAGAITTLAGLGATTLVAHADEWQLAAPMSMERVRHTATLLNSGLVLVAGGDTLHGVAATAQLYDPARNSWSPTGSMNQRRHSHTATLLPDGTVLVTGGRASFGGDELASAEIYDPAAGAWTRVPDMNSRRAYHTATLLPDGTVLVVGYIDPGATSQIFDPVSRTWSDAGTDLTPSGLVYHTAVLLLEGKVLVAGGISFVGDYAYIYEPVGRFWGRQERMQSRREGAAAIVLDSGQVLVTGGGPANAELYDQYTRRWSTTGPLSSSRVEHTASRLGDGRVLLVGGRATFTPLDTVDVYQPDTTSWVPGPRLIDARYGHTATVLQDGRLLVTGGLGVRNWLASTEILG